MVPSRLLNAGLAIRWLCSVGHSLWPPENYRQAEYREHRSTSILMTLVVATAGMSLWFWDHALDPSGARRTVGLRLGLLLTTTPYLATLLFRWNRRCAIVAAALTFTCWELNYFEIIQRLRGGLPDGLAGFVYFVAMPLLMTRGFPFATNAVLVAGIVLFPLVLTSTRLGSGFLFTQYVLLTIPAATIAIFAAWAFSRAYSKLWLAREQLERIASTDTLTGLPNRRHFIQLLSERAVFGEHVGLLAIDLDGFKAVNDTLGHRGGDELLRQVAERLSHCVRGDDVAARLGGDEFAVILGGSVAEAQAIEIARRILDKLGQPFRIGGRPVLVSCSIGIALDPLELQDLEQLYERADAAMYEVKESGRNGFRLSVATTHRSGLPYPPESLPALKTG